MTLTNLYKHLFVSTFGLKDDGTWLAALSDLTPQAIETGINSLMRLDAGSDFCKYPPKPLEFRSLCLSYYKSLRLPSVAQAFKEIETNSRLSKPRYSHDAIKYIDYMLGEEFFNSEDRQAMYLTFQRQYKKVCHYIKQGHQLPAVPVFIRALPQETSHVGISTLEHLKKRLGVR